MALNRQIDIYSCDTGHFYSGKEKYLHEMNCRYRQERKYVINALKTKHNEIHKLLDDKYPKETIVKIINNLKGSYIPKNMSYPIEISKELTDECERMCKIICHKREKAKESKSLLLKKLKNKMEATVEIETYNSNLGDNIKPKKLNYVRCLNENELNDNDVISVFESATSRTLGIKTNEFTDDLIVMQVYYFDLFKDVMFQGFMYKGERYIYYTSSAGQIRKKKAVFIKESKWIKHSDTITCGLSVEQINELGGSNVNKYLAYLALMNSATDEWINFDIDRAIVIDDFETDVIGTYDLVDESDYSVKRMKDSIPITHTDGCGMIRTGRNMMVRLPWIKGLLGVFDFTKLIIENGWNPVIKDIWGTEHNLLTENIEIIFTKSQFKMHKFYSSWQDYKDKFKKFGCCAGVCNVEERKIKNAKINYQMLQTITDINEDEIYKLCEKSIKKIKNICSTLSNARQSLGVSKSSNHQNSFQRAVGVYPSLINDKYAKNKFRDIKNSLLKKYRSGKLEINGKYTFLLPDFYAACEYWFAGNKCPTGLLRDGEVYCSLYTRYDTLDCLRSPHLYKEHAIRRNVANEESERTKIMKRYFDTNAVYTSSHDLISKILQFDVDGDKSLVVAEPLFVNIAKRNMKDVVPLYYNMRKAPAQKLNKWNVYNGLVSAFTGGNIGIYSNNISKIWNDEVFITGTQDEKNNAILAIKLLCCENNFVIDYAKTLYKPTRPKDKNELILKYTHKKLPAFFEYAKDKTIHQIENRNTSTVNKIFNFMPNPNIRISNLKLEKINYKKYMMNNPNIECDDNVRELYKKITKMYGHKINFDNENSNTMYVIRKIREEFFALNYELPVLCDMLVKLCYGEGFENKEILWLCFGDEICETLTRNTENKKITDEGIFKDVACNNCGKFFTKEIHSGQTICDKCKNANRQILNNREENTQEYSTYKGLKKLKN